MPQENQTDWIEWQGGECPVDYGTLVEVRHRDGEEHIDHAGGGYAEDWSVDLGFRQEGDIIAYRVVQA